MSIQLSVSDPATVYIAVNGTLEGGQPGNSKNGAIVSHSAGNEPLCSSYDKLMEVHQFYTHLRYNLIWLVLQLDCIYSTMLNITFLKPFLIRVI